MKTKEAPFETESVEQAERIISSDPFVLENFIEAKWIKEWVLE